MHEPSPVIFQRLWMAEGCKAVAAEVRGRADAQPSSGVKPFGRPRLLLEAIRDRDEAPIAAATTQSDRQPCLPASSTIPLQIRTAEFTNPTRTTLRIRAGPTEAETELTHPAGSIKGSIGVLLRWLLRTTEEVLRLGSSATRRRRRASA